MTTRTIDSFVATGVIASPAKARPLAAKGRRTRAAKAMYALIFAVAVLALASAILHPTSPSVSDTSSQVTLL